MPLDAKQNKELDDALFATLNSFTPPLTEGERNAINAAFGPIVDSYTTATGEQPPAAGLPIVDLLWQSSARSSTQTGACQFKVTVPDTEVPRPGSLLASPAGPAGNETFSYKWSKDPHADAEGGTKGSEAKFSVTKPGKDDRWHTVQPGETWYLARKMEGGNTGGKFVEDFRTNAPY